MNKYGAIALTLLILVSCSKYHVKREVNNRSTLLKFKNSGILFRIPHSSSITVKQYATSLSHWLDAYKRINSLKIIQTDDRNLSASKSEFDRFLQFSEDEDFLYYKSIGIITQYLSSNQEALKKLFEENGLDSLIIYEVNPSLSAEMQYTDFNSMIIIVNAGLQVAYLDHQYDDYNTNEYDADKMKNNLLDEINNRLLELMFKLKYIKEK
ncbi:MAG: hypothetical protein A2176_11780 [Spirochaetes bacterium RBG_13_51_14]|nr:MAG: hypothetical protein A2176_11780 [Spirochaetes bacterium RBG_13_51_14]